VVCDYEAGNCGASSFGRKLSVESFQEKKYDNRLSDNIMLSDNMFSDNIMFKADKIMLSNNMLSDNMVLSDNTLSHIFS
jgi:hypothetical protein